MEDDVFNCGAYEEYEAGSRAMGRRESLVARGRSIAGLGEKLRQSWYASEPKVRGKDDYGLLEMQRKPHVFCAYLTLNARGWQRLKISNNQFPPKRRLSSFSPKASSVIVADASRTADKGFEAVWLADEDTLVSRTKNWVQDPRGAPINSPGGHRPAPSPPRTTHGQRYITVDELHAEATDTAEIGRRKLAIWCIAATDDMKYVAAGTNHGLIYVWRLSSGPHPVLDWGTDKRMLERVATLSGHTGGIMRLHWNHSYENRVLVSCAFDSTVRLWSIFPSGALSILKCPVLPVGVIFASTHDDGKAVVTFLDGATSVIAFNPPPSQIPTLREHSASRAPPLINCKVVMTISTNGTATNMSVSPCGDMVAVGSQYGIVTISDLKTGKELKHLNCRNTAGKHANGEKITGIAWNSDGSYVAVTTRDGRIRVINVQNPKKWIKLKCKSDPTLKGIFDPSDRYILAPADNGYIHIWDLCMASQGEIRRRTRNVFLKNTARHSSFCDYDAKSIQDIDLLPLEPQMKRETAFPLASFVLPKGNVTAMHIIPHEDESLQTVRVARLLVGTDTGRLQICVALLS